MWREFRKVTLPMLGPFIEIALLLGVIYVLQIFAEIFVAVCIVSVHRHSPFA